MPGNDFSMCTHGHRAEESGVEPERDEAQVSHVQECCHCDNVTSVKLGSDPPFSSIAKGAKEAVGSGWRLGA